MAKTILIAEDEQILRESLAELLEGEGYSVLQAGNGQQAHDIAVAQVVDIVLSDIRMPELDGLGLLTKLKRIAPETPVIMITAFGTIDSAVEAMKTGAWDYLLKPVQFDDLLLKIERALDYCELSRDRRTITEQLASESNFHNLISESPAMMRLFDQVRKLSDVKSTVLLLGESGTGKELFAKAIHYNGRTQSKPFIAVNCGAIPDTLIESELFGHRRGAFTGAVRDKLGFFETANGGTLFLDEISTLPIGVQSSLLRVLEEHSITPVGDTRPRPIDIRVIAATNRELRAMVDKEEFREDLLYRLDVVQLTLPPLRQRLSDVPVLVHHFIEKYADQMNRTPLGITNGAMRVLLQHSWPGNIRELENVIERAMIFCEGSEIRVADLPFESDQPDEDTGEDLKDALRQFERQHILSSLRRHDYDKARTAQTLGIGISSLYRKLDELEIPKNEPGSDAPDSA